MNSLNCVSIDNDILGGIPVFKGTRVPVKNFFDYLRAGQSINEFLEDFDYIPRDYCLAILDISYSLLVNSTSDKITEKRKPSDFRGTLRLSTDQYKDFQNHLQNIRDEWDDNI